MENRLRNAIRRLRPKARVAADFLVNENDVAQHREQMFLDADNHLAIDKGGGRRIDDVELDAARTLNDADIEGAVAFQQLLGVVEFVAGVEHGQRAVAVKLVQGAMPAIKEFRRFCS